MNTMQLMLAIHVVFLVMWSASLVYFPHLFVREAIKDDPRARGRAIAMQRSLYALIMTPSALLAVAAGVVLIFLRGFAGGWLHVKLVLVLLMVFFHVYCGALMDAYRREHVRRQLWLYRWLPLLPAALVAAVVTLVSAKPF